jgi:hypothetical protein
VLLLALAGLVAGVRGATFAGGRCVARVATAVGRRVGGIGASAGRHGMGRWVDDGGGRKEGAMWH